MAESRHLEILARGTAAWNAWRVDHPFEVPDLSAANLAGADLRSIDLNPVLVDRATGASVRMSRHVRADQLLRRPAVLRHCNLSGADLLQAELRYADLTEANLSEARVQFGALQHAQFSRAQLSLANLGGSVLTRADFRNASCTGTSFGSAWAPQTNFAGAELVNADFTRALLDRADFSGAVLSQTRAYNVSVSATDFTSARFWRAEFDGAHGEEARFPGARLDSSSFTRSNLARGDFSGATLTRAGFSRSAIPASTFEGAELSDTDLSHADLRSSVLRGVLVSGRTSFRGADLSSAFIERVDLRGCDLSYSRLVGTFVSGARLSGCRVYGASVWDLEGAPADQDELIVTREHASAVVTVDELEVAQFIYLLLSNTKIKGVIDTLARRCVLILGRFTPERKAVLDAIRDELRRRGYVPMMFDFEKPSERDFTETIMTLAGMSLFVIADITNPKSSPLELQATVPNYQVPFVPIIQSGEAPFSMFKDLYGKFDWVLQPLEYDSAPHLVQKLQKAIVDRALKKHEELVLKKAAASGTLKLDEL